MQKQIAFLAQGNSTKFLGPVLDWKRESFAAEASALHGARLTCPWCEACWSGPT